MACLSALLTNCIPGEGHSDAPTRDDEASLEQFVDTPYGSRMWEGFVPGGDGTPLYTLVYLPAQGDGPFPTLLTRTPYDLPLTAVSGYPEQPEDVAEPEQFGWSEATDRGYALVIQLLRGRSRSEGIDGLLLDERADGAALVEWVEAQAFCDGRIGIFGDSAAGVASLMAAATGRPSIRAVYAQATTTNFFDGTIFPEGRLRWGALLTFALSQGLEASEDHYARLGLSADALGSLLGDAGELLGELVDALESGDPASSPWWTRAPSVDYPLVSTLQPRWGELLALRDDRSARAEYDVTDDVTAPTLHVSLWHDFFQASAFEAFTRIQDHGDHRLLVLDGTHYQIDDPARWPSRPMFEWFDAWVKERDNGVGQWPTVQYEVAGRSGEGVSSASSWPPPTTARPIDLRAPAMPLALDAEHPAPSLGGSHLVAPSGILDQGPLLDRPDVAVLEADASLDAELLLTGTVEGSLSVVDSGPTDLVLKLVDRDPAGRTWLVREQIVAVDGPGPLTFTFAPIAYRFEPGHTPGLLVTGASVPGLVSGREPWTGEVTLGDASLALPVTSP